MSKDPAVLFYIDKWLTATKTLKAHEKGWYLNLILFQYDLGSLPNDIEELAILCDVRHSEYDLFKQVFKQVLKQKFEVSENGRLENQTAKEILIKRGNYKDKRSKAGQISYLVKLMKRKSFTDKEIEHIKKNIELDDLDVKNEEQVEQVFKQMLKQKSELYINVDVNINKDINSIIDIYNEKCKNLPTLKSKTTKRKKSVNARIQEHGFDKVAEVINLASQSDFLNGKNKRGWVANFDWLINPNNFVKVLEGNYNKKHTANDKATMEKITTYD